MNEYMGVIRMFAGTFAPEDWMFCDGSLLPKNQFTALFNILGTTYGGDGITTFALPDLRGRVPIGASSVVLPAAPTVPLGGKGGEESHVLRLSEIPLHNHTAYVSSTNADSNAPSGATALGALGSKNGTLFSPANAYTVAGPNLTLNSGTVGIMGSDQPHENRQPYLALNYIICISGVYPPHP